jgi:hypothetical protein
MTQTAVSRIWRAFGLKPHKVDYWKLSTDPNFIDKLYDVVGLYLNPPERAIGRVNQNWPRSSPLIGPHLVG